MMSRRLHYGIASAFLASWALVAGALISSCASIPSLSTPSSLSAGGRRDFQIQRIVKALDLLRDTAVSAAAQEPPLVAFDTRQQIVRYHQSAVRLIAAGLSGWKASVLAGLEDAVANVPTDEREILQIYVTFVKMIISEVVE